MPAMSSSCRRKPLSFGTCADFKGITNTSATESASDLRTQSKFGRPIRVPTIAVEARRPGKLHPAHLAVFSRALGLRRRSVTGPSKHGRQAASARESARLDTTAPSHMHGLSKRPNAWPLLHQPPQGSEAGPCRQPPIIHRKNHCGLPRSIALELLRQHRPEAGGARTSWPHSSLFGYSSVCAPALRS